MVSRTTNEINAAIAEPRRPTALPPFPEGWYCLLPSAELAPGQVVTRQFVGKEIVIFRTRNGDVAAMEAHCPHMGAHMGHGGSVDGETLRCPFHGFQFDVTGECVATPYGTLPSPLCVVPSWPVHEFHGLILAYHHPDGAEPTWRVPELDDTGYANLRTRSWTLNSHPQETSENSVDVGHFTAVHQYENFETVSPMKAEGTQLHARYAFTRPVGLLSKKGNPIRVEIDVDAYGLGYSIVHVRVPQYGVTIRHWVLSTPRDDGHVELRVALTLKNVTNPAKINPVLVLVPKTITTRLMANAAFRGYCKDVSDDFAIWNHKAYVDPPLLARGDGPVMKYRRWAEQFYV